MAHQRPPAQRAQQRPERAEQRAAAPAAIDADFRRHLRRHGIRAVIPQPAGQAASPKRLGRFGGRPPSFDREAYKQRNTVERRINKLNEWRGLATRYDKPATIYLAGLHLAAIFIWSAR
ncbi:transposase [Streptomyces vinaceus]|uniref:transposase n=1 Tax=Streptomyces vinaceus TaxID=1960 RepID=UPI0035DBE86C